MNPKYIFENRAVQAGPDNAEEVNCLDCDEELVFAMRDQHHTFSIGLRTVLQCLMLAEKKGKIPLLSDSWWISIACRHGIEEIIPKFPTQGNKMHTYQLREDGDEKELSRSSFEEDTRKCYPYYQQSCEKESIHFAVCPECKNPIQIIGLYSHIRPFAMHCACSIPRIASFDQDSYANCTLAHGNKKGT